MTSLLYLGQGPGNATVLAPIYDTLSTAVYPALTPKMAMKIGSMCNLSEVRARHWEQLAEDVGLARAQAKRRTLELAKLLPATARTLQSAPEYDLAAEDDAAAEPT